MQVCFLVGVKWFTDISKYKTCIQVLSNLYTGIILREKIQFYLCPNHSEVGENVPPMIQSW